jgi:hypothetical protein
LPNNRHALANAANVGAPLQVNIPKSGLSPEKREESPGVSPAGNVRVGLMLAGVTGDANEMVGALSSKAQHLRDVAVPRPAIAGEQLARFQSLIKGALKR